MNYRHLCGLARPSAQDAERTLLAIMRADVAVIARQQQAQHDEDETVRRAKVRAAAFAREARRRAERAVR